MPPSIAILGSGNMAYHLLVSFKKAGVNIVGLISRDIKKGETLLRETNVRCGHITGYSLRTISADIILLAVSESGIGEVLDTYDFHPEHIIVHTSGAVSIDLISTKKRGVFYPLQTLTRGESLDFSKVPILIEGADPSIENKLIELGRAISQNVKVMFSEDRLRVHLAAVFVSNFSNHLFRKAEKLLLEVGLRLDDLSPLIIETVRKSLKIGPHEAQTGPARRGDKNTIEEHLTLIHEPRIRNIYRCMSDSINEDYENQRNE